VELIEDDRGERSRKKSQASQARKGITQSKKRKKNNCGNVLRGGMNFGTAVASLVSQHAVQSQVRDK